MRADLEAIEARCKAATEGPWTGAVEPCQAAPECDDVDLPAYVRAGRKVVAFIGEGYGDDYEADATFIAHARTDLPALVAEVRELRAALEAWQFAYRGVRSEAEAEAARIHADALTRAALNPAPAPKES